MRRSIYHYYFRFFFAFVRCDVILYLWMIAIALLVVADDNDIRICVYGSIHTYVHESSYVNLNLSWELLTYIRIDCHFINCVRDVL